MRESRQPKKNGKPKPKPKLKTKPAPPTKKTLADYEIKKKREAERSRTKSRAGREIADDYKPVTDKKLLALKKRILKDLKLFCETIFPKTFYLEWSEDHLWILGQMADAIVNGGQLAIAMPRGSGKTAMVVSACLWAILNGYHQFVMMVAATGDAAVELLEGLRMQLETNAELLKLFPEVVYPIQRLEGITQRRLLWEGELIRVELTDKRIILPNLPANPAASAIIATAGITGRIRGKKYTRDDGQEVRPSLVLLDDPQDDDSAKSEKQCDFREGVTNGAVLGLAGPDKEITAFAAVTSIMHNDYAERILDRGRNPQWHGKKTRMVDKWPTHPDAEAHWAKYAEILRGCWRDDVSTDPATNYYRANRKVMDHGAELRWPARKGKTAISALQHAYDIRIKRGDHAFEAEYQNNPAQPLSANAKSLDADVLVTRLNRIPRGTAPAETIKLTAFIDIQEAVLFWMVCGWDANFGGAIVAYGAWPEQNRMQFDLTTLSRTLQQELPNAGLEAQIYHGLKQLTKQLLGREWPRHGGSVARIEKCPIDANWPKSTDVVYQFCRESEFGTIVIPSHGHFFGAKNRQGMNNWARKPGDIVGQNWRSPVPSGKRVIRHVLWDGNGWKSHAAQRLLTPMGAPSAVTLNGTKPEEHRMLASHLTSEYSQEVGVTGGRTTDEWSLHVGRRNDWWDTFTGNCVAGSMLGCGLKETTSTPQPKPSIPDHMIAGSAR